MKHRAGLELERARQLRPHDWRRRKTPRTEARGTASPAGATAPTSINPGLRAAGASRALAVVLAGLCRPDFRVLEVGCGGGYTCGRLAPHVREIVGTEASEPAVAEARELLARHGIANARIVPAAENELAAKFPSESFDLAVSIGVYEHLQPKDGQEHLRQVCALLKPGGACVVVTLNRLRDATDATRELAPDVDEPSGIHRNASTNRELMTQMSALGFCRFTSVLPWAFREPRLWGIWFPARLCVWAEAWHPWLHKVGLGHASGAWLGIVLKAVKGGEAGSNELQSVAACRAGSAIC